MGLFGPLAASGGFADQSQRTTVREHGLRGR